jgi:hypothetical protein
MRFLSQHPIILIQEKNLDGNEMNKKTILGFDKQKEQCCVVVQVLTTKRN